MNLHKNSVVKFEKPQQLLITSEQLNSQITMLFLQADEDWYQIFLDEKVLFINKIIDNDLIDEILSDYNLTKLKTINFFALTPLSLTFDFDKSLLIQHDEQQILMKIYHDSFIYQTHKGAKP